MSGAAPRLDLAIPNVFVRDFQAALAYYTGPLGFTTQFTFGNPAFYAHVYRNRVKLALRHVDGPVINRDAGEDLLSAFVEVVGVDSLFDEMRTAGATVHHAPRNEVYGVRDFIVRDLDGNLLCFGEDMPRE